MRKLSISNLSVINRSYQHYFFGVIEILIYLFSSVTILIQMFYLLDKEDDYIYYGVLIFLLYMMQWFYGFLSRSLYDFVQPKLAFIIKLFFLEHLAVLVLRRHQPTAAASDSLYKSILSASFFQGRILSVMCIYLISFYQVSNEDITVINIIGIAATSLNIGLFKPQFFIGDDACSEDAIHYSVEVYTRAAFYSILFLVKKDDYIFSNSSTIIDFFVITLLTSASLVVIHFFFNIIKNRISILDSLIGSIHLFCNCIYLRLPSNIAVHRYRLLFLRTSSRILNPQIVLISAIFRLSECCRFFYLYYEYLDEIAFSSNMVKIQIRISIITSAIYAYILFFQIFYVMVASATKMRESVDDEINLLRSTQLGLEIQQSYIKNSSSMIHNHIRNSNGNSSNEKGSSTKGSKSNKQQLKQMNSNAVLTPIIESESNFKISKSSKNSNHNSNAKNGQLENNNLVIMTSPVQPFDKNCSPSSSTDNASVIYQQDFEENQGFHPLKLFSPNANNFPAHKPK